MQLKSGPPPVGVMFDTALNRSEHVLAMAALYKLQSTREARVASLSVSRSDLRIAAFCDALARYLSGAGSRNVAPIGIPAKLAQGQPANAMAEAVLNERTADGQPRYPHGITRLNDTADVAALIRNGISAQQPDNGGVVVAGPLSNIAAVLALPEVPDLAAKRVRALVIAATAEDLRADLPAVRIVMQRWPTPLALVEVPELMFPGGELAMRFAWAANHPVRDAYEAFQKMPYDAPLQSAAAVWHAVHPQSELFALSGPGTIDIMDDGRTRFTASGNGTHRMLRVAPNQRDAAAQAIVELISAQPQPPSGAGRGRGKQEE
jgi:hypothetical protein